MMGHLIHVGYPKTASSFLRRWFEAHPQLAYVEGGIAGYRNVYGFATQAFDSSAAIRFRVTSCEALTTPNPYIGQLVYDHAEVMHEPAAPVQTAVAGRLADLFPQARVLILTRGFRSMLMSLYSQFMRTGGALDFAMYCEYMARQSTSGEGAFDYSRVIDIYTTRFGESNVIVLPYEYLRDDADAFMRDLERRLGLDHFAPARERINTALSPVELRWYPRITRAVRALPVGPRIRRRVLRRYLSAANQNRFRHLISILQRLSPATPVTSDMLPEAVVETFRGKADRLRGDPLYAPYARDYLF